MNQKIIGLVFFVILFSLKQNCMCQNIKEYSPPMPDTNIIVGKFVKHQFHNKIGKAIEGAYDVFFKTEYEETFVKRIHCKFLEGELKDNFNILFEVKAIKTFGLWDADDNTVQSRVGDYVEIYEIIRKIEE